ncbi:MAG: hypothetical protein DWQ34_28440 [Planctomycetota bacterium]|nr:MAG: hypothetical protein DWQ29_20050 [Planctomycetota bacterium]REJ85674.1 MAG: hypothetical protein DWQ34_28440 [Planctomycetota bacterium]REK21434.1 MAG: hypothetical protein DWQ41_21630 [Planctomycetota bacterium]REK40054.1 MAG: hypothetical protein DWQ45_00415 [Planctomycetota bacterium]
MDWKTHNRFEPAVPGNLLPLERVRSALRSLGRRSLCFTLTPLVLFCVALPADAQQAAQRHIALELYIDGGAEQGDVEQWMHEAVDERDGVSVRVVDVSAGGDDRTRFETICSHFRLDPDASLPMVYGCGQHFSAPKSKSDLEAKLDSMRTMTVYVRSGCPRCAATKRYLSTAMQKYPGFKLVYRDVRTDRQASSDMNDLARRYRKSGVSVPVFHFCNQLQIGWSGESSSGRRLEQALDRWTYEKSSSSGASLQREQRSFNSTAAQQSADRERTMPLLGGTAVRTGVGLPAAGTATWSVWVQAVTQADPASGPRGPPEETPPDEQPRANADDNFELPLPPAPDASDAPALPLPVPIPEDAEDSGGAPPLPPVAPAPQKVDTIFLPIVGEVRISDLGMPLFTIVIGLVDGFNPCAMWVLLFLLSILVNLKNRWKIIAVAGSFVFVSGVAYFLFMALTLNVFELVPARYERVLHATLGVIALVIGSIHVKDFFAFKKGVSLSIPESAKAGIAARVRAIVMAENLMGAIIGAMTLAVLINLIELMCTAGLPALYAEVLASRDIEGWGKYGYLLLYNLAYMFDDALMVAIVVTTLDKTRLQEKQGRWLKLLSGVFVLALGLIMLINPDLLNYLSP